MHLILGMTVQPMCVQTFDWSVPIALAPVFTTLVMREHQRGVKNVMGS